MPSEPTGTTIDGAPWPEACPPHLPDALTRLSPWLIPFVLLAVLQAVAAWLEWDTQGELVDPGYGVSIVMGRLPGVCAALFGAALVHRHPDAYRRLPMLLAGVTLLAVAALMRLATGPLEAVLLGPLSGLDDGSTFVIHGIFSAAISVVSIFGLLYLARGLDGARRSAEVVSTRRLGGLLAVVAVAATVMTVMLVLANAQASEILTPLNIAAVALSFISMLAWSYVFVVAFGGWRAGEEPRIGWLLAALAVGIELASRVIIAIGGLVNLWQVGDVVLPILSVAFVAEWVLLLLAFLAGLPSTAPTADPLAVTPRDSAEG